MSSPSIPTLSWTWLALLILLAITCASAYIGLGALNTCINIGIAVVKALLVGAVFMHLRQSSPLVRLFAAAGVVWLLILAGLGAADFLTRS